MAIINKDALSDDALKILELKNCISDTSETCEWIPETKITLWSWRLRWSTTSHLIGLFLGQASNESAIGIVATLDELAILFEPLSQLKILRLNNNIGITGEPQALNKLITLKELNLSHTNVSGQNGLIGLEHLVCDKDANLLYLELNGLINLYGLIPTIMTKEPKFRLQIEGTNLRSEMKEVSISVAQFPFTLVPSEVILNLDRLCKHEEAKENGKIIWANMTKNAFSVWYMNNSEQNYVRTPTQGSSRSPTPHSPTIATAAHSSTTTPHSPTIATAAASHSGSTFGTSGLRGVYVSRGEVAFVSHRWLDGNASEADGGAHPDDKLNSKLTHLKSLVNKYKNSIKYWWVDFMCVPQNNPEATMTAIFSLPHYVKCCSKFFVLIDDQHSNDRYHMKSWNQSGWCRLERLAACAPFEADVYRSDSLQTLTMEAIVSLSSDLSEFNLRLDDPSTYEPLDGTFWDDNDNNKPNHEKDREKIKPVRDVLMGMFKTSTSTTSPPPATTPTSSTSLPSPSCTNANQSPGTTPPISGSLTPLSLPPIV